MRSVSDGAPPPPWVQELVDDRTLVIEQSCRSRSMTRLRSARHTLISVRVADAVSLDARRLRLATFDAYVAIAHQLEIGQHRHPVRFWNYIPDIHGRFDDGRDRYMAFNAGRFDAFTQWYGGPSAFAQHLPTASGVGCMGSDLVVHCLAAAAPGSAVENPRQIPSYHYSPRFGPLPPCFARATVVGARTRRAAMLLVGGTASVRGEESVYQDDLPRQMDETLVNLASLVRAARCMHSPRRALRQDDTLHCFRELRVYYTRGSQQDEIVAAVQAAFGGLRRMELMQADLCRSELLVEIEGMAVI